MIATLYLGFLRGTELDIPLEDGDSLRGYAEVACPECEGTGWWGYAEPLAPAGDCVVCKGTGFVYISV